MPNGNVDLHFILQRYNASIFFYCVATLDNNKYKNRCGMSDIIYTNLIQIKQ